MTTWVALFILALAAMLLISNESGMIAGIDATTFGYVALLLALLVFIGRYFTRAPRLTVVFSLLKTTVLHPNFGELPHKILALGLTAGDLLIVAAGILIVHIVEFFEERGTDVRGWLNARKSSVQVLILLVSLLILAFFGIFRSGYISSEFIYGQF